MISKKSKLNKFVLYVSSIAIALFVFAYSVGEVKASMTLSNLTYFNAQLGGVSTAVVNGNSEFTFTNTTDGDSLVCLQTDVGGMMTTYNINPTTAWFNSVVGGNEMPVVASSTIGNLREFLYVYSGDISGDFKVIIPNADMVSWGYPYRSSFQCVLVSGLEYESVVNNNAYIVGDPSFLTGQDFGSDSDSLFFVHYYYTGESAVTFPNATVSGSFMASSLTATDSSNKHNTFYASGDLTNASVYNGCNHSSCYLNLYQVNFNESSGGGGEMPIEDPTSGIVSYFMFEDSYRCAQNSTCIIRYKYNQNYIPEDTNEMTLSDEDYNVIATSTIESFSELGKTNGNSRITFEVASSTPLGGYWYYANAEEDTDSEWVFASPIYIQVFDGSIPDATYVWDTKEDISTLWGDSYTLACSTQEWAEADDANFFNMIRLKCHATKTTLDIFFSTLNVAKNVFSNVYESGKTLLKNMFPFNMIYKVKYQWDRSANLSLPLDLVLIENTVNSGELSVKINKELLSSSEDVYWVLWGDDLWAGNTEVKAFFDFIRALSKYFMWALFLLGLYKMGTDFFNEYMYENKLSSQRNSDWQYDQFKD